MTDEDFRTPDEKEILQKFRSHVLSEYQYQVWHNDTLEGTFWTRDEAEIHAKDLWSNGIWGDDEFRFREYWNTSNPYQNLEIKSPDGRWMTSNTFTVKVLI
jgi:hypothetical protein